MPALVLLPGTVRRSVGGLPQLPLQNLFAESAITEPSQFTLLARPRLALTGAEYGAGPIRAIYREDGVLSGSIIAVSFISIYVDGALEGSLAIANPVSIAGVANVGAILAAGNSPKFWDGSTLQTVDVDSQLVVKVIDHQSRFVFITGSNRYYWTLPGTTMLTGGNVDVNGLDFASAESEPDRLLDAVVFRDHLVLGGRNTVEFHGVTGNDDLPWSPTLGSALHIGVFATGCMTRFAESVVWLSPDLVVYQSAGGTPTRISDSGIEETLAKSSLVGVYLDTFFHEGHEFLRIKMDADYPDLVFDAQTREWSEWANDSEQFVGGVVQGPDTGLIASANSPIFGSVTDGMLYSTRAIDGATYGWAEDPQDMIFRVGLPIDGGVVTINNLLLRCQVGAEDDAVIQMRYSRDKGQSWTSWIDGDLGDAGDYRTKVEWRALGMQDQPGFLAEIKVSGATQFGVSGAYYNEPVMGRSRG